uniref:ANK_REP_REGION domain-containing protein n=1 Tax=Macrostomum lignano TaxID=282301 RepID=A0A1I8FMG4_9PLAT
MESDDDNARVGDEAVEAVLQHRSGGRSSWPDSASRGWPPPVPALACWNRLIRLHRMSVEARDWRTAGHRCTGALYHGQLETAVRLISSFGASLSAPDHNGLTPRAAFPAPRPRPDPGYDAYTWGDSANHTSAGLVPLHCRGPAGRFSPRPARRRRYRHLPWASITAHSLLADGRVCLSADSASTGWAWPPLPPCSRPEPTPCPPAKRRRRLPQRCRIGLGRVAVGREHTLMLTGRISGRLSAQLLANATAAAATAEIAFCLGQWPAGGRETGRRVLAIAAARYHSAVVTVS